MITMGHVEETCSDVDQSRSCRSTTTHHGKPRRMFLLDAVHHDGSLYTSPGCRLALIVLLFCALSFPAAVARSTQGSIQYSGWQRQFINDSGFLTYFYYPVQEEEVLSTLRNSWSLEINWPLTSSDPFPCFMDPWPGIVCDWFRFQDMYNSISNYSYYFHIIELDLSSRGIQGPLPREVVNLTNLITLNLHDNGFNGSIPSIYSNLTSLNLLDLSDNNLTGPIPPELGLLNLESLYLYGNQLNGTIPMSSNNNQGIGIDNMTTLVTLRLQNNNLSGELPDLRNALSIREVNLSANHMNGSINIDSIFNSTSPKFELAILDLSSNHFSNISNFNSLSASFQQLRLNFNNIYGSVNLTSINASCTYKVDLSGNVEIQNVSYNSDLVLNKRVSIMLENTTCCDRWTKSEVPQPSTEDIHYFCNANYTPPKRTNHNLLIISILLATMFILLVAFFCLYRKSHKDKKMFQHENNLQQQKVFQIQQEFAKKDVQPTLYAYNELKIATKDFHDNMKLGEGSFGIVYKGVLKDENEIAVKLLLTEKQQGMEEFLNEVVLVTAVRHKNLVKLKGCCFGPHQQRILVYEFVENNNLAKVLFEGVGDHNMDWPIRKNMCFGIARGLNYLHQDAQPERIIHRDIKPANILLDKNLHPKIADFGLARLFPKIGSHISTLNIAGTMGYLAPEYASRGQLSDKVDVFSFGVVLLEILSGRKTIEPKFDIDQIYLLDWAWKLHEKDKLLELVDPKLHVHDIYEEILRTINVGLLCVQPTPSRRPSMAKVVAMLQGDMEAEIVIKDSQHESYKHDPFPTGNGSSKGQLDTIIELSNNVDEEPLLVHMMTTSNHVSSHSYGTTSNASQNNTLGGFIELTIAKPR